MSWAVSLSAEKLTSMGDAPDWSRLDEYQAQLTMSDFRWLLESQYAPNGTAQDWITVEREQALVLRSEGDAEPYVIQFRDYDASPARPPRYWQTRAEWLAMEPDDLPLAGLKIALDPGHLGGEYAAMEFRSWQAKDGPLFREGDFVLAVAQLLKPQLEALGATVYLVRDKAGPVTSDTPESLRPLAAKLVAERELTPGLEIDLEDRERKIDALARLLFYRVSEIKARAELVNDQFQPDIALCLHVDGTTPPKGKDLADQGYAHYLVNGAYSANELSYDDQRLQMLERMLSGAWREERGLAGAMSASFGEVYPQPPYAYSGSNAVRINEDPYIWARNLMANRLYQCPTVFLEPCVANEVGFYTQFASEPDSLIALYADCVRQAILQYYTPQTPD
ncbi:hypothetical protein [Cerasicoccus frondis]|uniref:hypothetical protein n=1 Tax=Cerasicoccus frondis TaxID=490090 RepID=UPI002852D42F|nr:hypothetical protein [Cerasicoccus frondis]